METTLYSGRMWSGHRDVVSVARSGSEGPWLVAKEGLWHQCMLRAQPRSSYGSFSPWVWWLHFSLTWGPTKAQDLYCHPPPGSVSAGCLHLLGEGTWGLWCAQDEPVFPCSVPSIWEEPHWATPVMSLGALKEWRCCRYMLLRIVLDCLCPTHTIYFFLFLTLLLFEVSVICCWFFLFQHPFLRPHRWY